MLALPITAMPDLSHQYLAPRNDFDPGYPANPEPEPASQHPATSYNLSAIIVAAVVIPICVIALAFCIYRRRRKTNRSPQIVRYQADGATFVTSPPPAAAAPARRTRRVWRAEPALNGVPAYTSEAATGELSLGVGRKQSTEEYEMVNVESTAERRESSGTMLEGVDDEGDEEVEATPAPAVVAEVPDPLPPYVPPPPPAVTVSHVRSMSSESARTATGSPGRQ